VLIANQAIRALPSVSSISASGSAVTATEGRLLYG
jgi:hypothetical protein